ncbi:rna polymerase sigma factor [Liquorilactobacillus oeni DSM 19972]|uniref:Rna polymerase sigma factor n=2 Tax=Liquorilactobacillus oeni TaxID=303241 RepID=A0A0R1MAL1_9LACO|nr:rna polymerase sigma factor [Liquorilactobacillus oeni DSM 19972]
MIDKILQLLRGGGLAMTQNLETIIEYINDNLMFGSKIKSRVIDSLFHDYSISADEKDAVYKELGDLNITIEYSKYYLKKKLDKLFIMIGPKKELKQSNLDKWFEVENINSDLQKKVRTHLDSSGYSIINDVHNEMDLGDFDFLDDLDLDCLDEVLDDEKFNAELSFLQDVVDKSKNFEYLIDLHNDDIDFEKKRTVLDDLAKANERLVWKIVNRYAKLSTPAFDVNDMAQAGIQGLMKAAEKFDISLGNQFSTYATWWIRQGITRSIADCSTTIRVPVHMRERIIRFTKIEAQFWNENSRTATDDELADDLEISKKELRNLKLYRNMANLTSLDIPIGNEEKSYLCDFIPDKNNKTPEESAEEEALKQELKNIFKEHLTNREETILLLRFGLIDGVKHTLEEIGEVQGVTRERIRQIESKAIRKLRHPNVIERLMGFYHD